MSLIQLKNITKTYHTGGNVEVPALRGVSLTVEPGEFVAIMGPSGSGKSTLLAVLGLLDKADSGEYFLLDKNVSSLKESDYARLRNRFFGFVFQTFNLLNKMNVTENVLLPFIYADGPTAEKKQAVAETLKQVGLADRLSHKSNELSGGQQQRVALVRALANKPLVILADEPTGNLDSKSSEEIIQLLKKINQQGNTIIMVTHEHDIAASASRVITLHDGQIISDEKRKIPVAAKPPEYNLAEKHNRRFCCLASLKNYAYEAFLSIINNKLRSVLSILGVMIGVAAVITMLALGTGARKKVEERFSALGTNILMVRSSGRVGGISLGGEGPTRFNFADLEMLKKIDSIEYLVPYASGRAQAVFGSNNWNTSVTGTSTDYLNLRNVVIPQGRFFTPQEAESRAKVVLVGQTVVTQLFGEANPVGQWLKINRVNFNIIGVMPKQGAMGFRDQDDQIFMPVKTAMYRLLGEDYINYFEVKAKNASDLDSTSTKIIDAIMRLHHLPEAQRQSIEVTNLAQIQEAFSAVIQTLSLLLGAVASISLLVGGIGIMNIMLVMVMERTHEIGLRKALGAQKSDILLQFLVEAVLICLLGGTIGILFGVFISWLLSVLAQWVIYISLGSIILAFTFSVMVGIIFGLWPALRAAKLLPIEALRYE